jgi:hypothetical protein
MSGHKGDMMLQVWPDSAGFGRSPDAASDPLPSWHRLGGAFMRDREGHRSSLVVCLFSRLANSNKTWFLVTLEALSFVPCLLQVSFLRHIPRRVHPIVTAWQGLFKKNI